MARLRDIVIDAVQSASLARFWGAAALDGYEILLDPEGNAFCLRDPDPQ